MDPTTKIELMYRVRVRQTQDTDDFFLPVFDEVLSIVGDRAEYRDRGVIHWPIRDSDVMQAEKNGFIVQSSLSGFHLCVREYIITIPISSQDDSLSIIEDILERCGNVFDIVQMITEMFTDVGPK